MQNCRLIVCYFLEALGLSATLVLFLGKCYIGCWVLGVGY